MIFVEPSLYADINDIANNIFWNIRIIKYIQVFGCRIPVQLAWIQTNHFTKNLRTKDMRLTLAKLYPGTMDTINA